MNEILVKHGGIRSEIAKTFGVSAVTVRSALKGRTQSKLAVKIRKMAMERGGMEITGDGGLFMKIQPLNK